MWLWANQIARIQSHDCTLNVLLQTEACNKLLFTIYNDDRIQPVTWTITKIYITLGGEYAI